MLNHSIIMFIIGWALWFLIDKHPASLGTMMPAEMDDLLNNFQLAFDMMKAGYLKASYVFIWQAHYIVLSIIAGLLSSIAWQGMADVLRRRRLREVMSPNRKSSSDTDKQDPDSAS